MNLTEIQQLTEDDIKKMAIEVGMPESGLSGRRNELLNKVLNKYSEREDFNIIADGILSVLNDGYGFLRQVGGQQGSSDVYVSQSQIRRFSLRTGDEVSGQVRAPKQGERYFGLTRVEAVNGIDPEAARNRPKFEKLTPIHPLEQIKLQTSSKSISARLIDMLAPVGKGQRGMIVSPPKAGKTTLLKEIAAGITENSPNIHLMVALIGERPEEVTDMRRSVKGEVFSSTFDEPVEDHTRVAELVLARSKRLVEAGKDVVILLDSLTRLTRAYNLAVPTSGRTLSGGIDPIALYPPKKFFGAARNMEEGGSLTILAACLVETGSRMDDVIYEEFKGTGNMEVHLDRKLAERRMFPSIDIQKSGTRREELLMSEEALKQVWLLRRMLSMADSRSDGNSHEVIENLFSRLSKTKNNDEFLSNLGRELVK
ncbi:MAG: transcription termination factor Rho [Chloroflexi bacterium]|jgi:transcription termination factor Rho|nr:MAG: transcription termination factor Rho [Chloroflexota bacterium]